MLTEVDPSLVLSLFSSSNLFHSVRVSPTKFKMNQELMSLCLLAITAVISIALLPSAEASPTALAKEEQVRESNRTGITPVTEPPCHGCIPTCPPHPDKPPTTKFPNLPSVTYSTNCDFCDHDLYTLTCVATPFDCAARCAVDLRCSHFTYVANLNGGTCVLKKAFGSGGAWASSVPSPSPYVCGYIPSRALIGIFLNICVGLDITGSGRN